MEGLPYLIPDRELALNTALLTLILNELGVTKKGKECLTNERLFIFFILLKNPVILDRLLIHLDGEGLNLSEADRRSVESISTSIEPLFNKTSFQELIKILAAKELMQVRLTAEIGFTYTISEKGKSLCDRLQGTYFSKLRNHLSLMDFLQKETETKLRKAIYQSFHKE